MLRCLLSTHRMSVYHLCKIFEMTLSVRTLLISSFFISDNDKGIPNTQPYNRTEYLRPMLAPKLPKSSANRVPRFDRIGTQNLVYIV